MVRDAFVTSVTWTPPVGPPVSVALVQGNVPQEMKFRPEAFARTLALYRGLAVGLLGTKAVTDFTQKWLDLATNTIGTAKIPVIIIPFIIVAIGFAVLLHFSTFGRGVYDVGLNKEAAHFTGVNVERTKLILFLLSGVVVATPAVQFCTVVEPAGTV